MLIVFYISGHGLGHASREVEVVNAIAARHADVRFIIRSGAPSWLLEHNARAKVEIQAFDADTGVEQIDSLRLDEGETARRAAAFYRDMNRRVDDEAVFLRERHAALVVGDIPPLAFSAAARAGIPSIAIGNFTWDWIYRGYPIFDTAAPGVIETIQEAYSHATPRVAVADARGIRTDGRRHPRHPVHRTPLGSRPRRRRAASSG